jgi:putative ABC transport system substrate-binding protein
MEVSSREARGPDELDRAFRAIAGERPDGLLVHGSPAFVPHARRITEFAAAIRLPARYYLREFVEAGGLMAYGPNVPALTRGAALQVDKILR